MCIKWLHQELTKQEKAFEFRKEELFDLPLYGKDVAVFRIIDKGNIVIKLRIYPYPPEFNPRYCHWQYGKRNIKDDPCWLSFDPEESCIYDPRKVVETALKNAPIANIIPVEYPWQKHSCYKSNQTKK